MNYNVNHKHPTMRPKLAINSHSRVGLKTNCCYFFIDIDPLLEIKSLKKIGALSL